MACHKHILEARNIIKETFSCFDFEVFNTPTALGSLWGCCKNNLVWTKTIKVAQVVICDVFYFCFMVH